MGSNKNENWKGNVGEWKRTFIKKIPEPHISRLLWNHHYYPERIRKMPNTGGWRPIRESLLFLVERFETNEFAKTSATCARTNAASTRMRQGTTRSRVPPRNAWQCKLKLESSSKRMATARKVARTTANSVTCSRSWTGLTFYFAFKILFCIDRFYFTVQLQLFDNN